MTRFERDQKSKAERIEQNRKLGQFFMEIVMPVTAQNLAVLADSEERITLKISPVDIRKEYGQNCLDIFRLLFTLHQVGGRSLTGDTYVSMWVANIPSFVIYTKAIAELKGTMYTPKEMLAKMVQLGAEQSMRAKLLNTTLYTTAEVQEYKKVIKDLRKQERDELNEVREFYSGTYF